MSGIAGIFHRDGRPVDGADLRAMTATMSHRGPDGIEQHVAGPLGMAHCLLRTLPDAREKLQPAWDQRGEICLTLDGRIDNRQELRLALGSAARNIRDDTDAELLISAYQHWGDACIALVIGDFSFALWDARLRRLVCARDFLGKRPFYYHYNGSTFRWASEPQAVLADRSIPRVPNEGMIGEYLSSKLRSTTDTLFRELYRLAPAHLLSIDGAGLQVSQYWDGQPDEPVVCGDDRDYAANFLTLCAEATEARLQTRSPAALNLSGGVDSGSLLGIIEYLRRGGRHDTPLETYSLAFPGRACDETEYIRSITNYCNIQSHIADYEPTAAEPYQAQARKYLDLPDYPTGMMLRPLRKAARESGCRVVFTGSGPDQWLVNLDTWEHLVRQLQFRRLGADVRSTADAWGWREALGQLLVFGLRQQLPPRLRRAGARALGRTPCPPWLETSFCRASGLADRLQSGNKRVNSSTFALTDAWQTHATEVTERSLASIGMQRLDPFDDRRVVEHALALPENQRARGDVTKYVLRTAVTGTIPETIRNRSDKAEFSDVFREELRLHGGSALFEGMALEDLHWVDGSRVREMYAGFERKYKPGVGPESGEQLRQLWMICSLERWLRVL